MPWELAQLTSKQKALLFALIDIRLEDMQRARKAAKD